MFKTNKNKISFILFYLIKIPLINFLLGKFNEFTPV